jgi:hypothetical protein
MVDMSRFLGKPREYDIDGEKVTLRPLKGKDLDLFMGSDAESGKGVLKLVHHVIREQQDPNITLEQVGEFSLAAINAWAEAIMDVNGLKKPQK